MILDWITDPHVTHLPNMEEVHRFVLDLKFRSSQGLIISGDIAEGPTVARKLQLLQSVYERKIYFVLGNHDYFGRPMHETIRDVRNACNSNPNLYWLNDWASIGLGNDTALIGHDGWYCGQLGLGNQTEVTRSDFTNPEGVRDLYDLYQQDKSAMFAKCLELANASAQAIQYKIELAVDNKVKRILVVTHVPPFRFSSRYRGKICDAASAPFFVNDPLGQVLLSQARKNPDVNIEVFSGHTHCAHSFTDGNLQVHVGEAAYRKHVRFLKVIEI